MDALVTVVGFALGFGLVWYIANRKNNQRPHIEAPLPKPNLHLVIAGNAHQCRYWAERNFSPEERKHVRYLLRADDIRGYHGNTVHLHLVGTYYERPDYTDVRDYTIPYAKQHDIVVRNPEDV